MKQIMEDFGISLVQIVLAVSLSGLFFTVMSAIAV